MRKFNTSTITVLGFFVALEIIFSRFLSINAWNIKIGFNFLPVAAAALLYGPTAAGTVWAAGDFLGAVLFPIGPYFPGFTATAFMMGYVFGKFLHEKTTLLHAFAAVAANQVLLSLLLNSVWISILYDSPYLPLLGSRSIQTLILIPVQTVTIWMICPVLNRCKRSVAA